MSERGESVNGINRGFGTRSPSKSGRTKLRARSHPPLGDERAVLAAQIMRAFDSLITSGLGRLRLYYAARLAAVLFAARGDPRAALAALQSERDQAIENLRLSLLAGRHQALRAARASTRTRPVIAHRQLRIPLRPGLLGLSVRLPDRSSHAQP